MTEDKKIVETTAHGHKQRDHCKTQSRIKYYMGGTRFLLYCGDERFNPPMQGANKLEDCKHEHDNALLALHVSVAEGESPAVKYHEHDRDRDLQRV